MPSHGQDAADDGLPVTFRYVVGAGYNDVGHEKARIRTVGAWIHGLASEEAFVDPLRLHHVDEMVESEEVIGEVGGAGDDMGVVGDFLYALCLRIEGHICSAISFQETANLQGWSAHSSGKGRMAARRTS